jgi:hypothetical protein
MQQLLSGCMQAADLPRLGSAMPVVLYALDARCGAQKLPAAGDWVKLRNVAACVVQGQLQARLPAVPHFFPPDLHWAPPAGQLPACLTTLPARIEPPTSDDAPEVEDM